MGIVLKPETALNVALKLVPEGKRLTIYTRNTGRARTNVVAVLRKSQTIEVGVTGRS